MSHRDQNEAPRQIPAWLLGLIIAAVLFVVGFFVLSALGFGDDPVIEQVLIPLVLVSGRHSAKRIFTTDR